MVKEIDRRQFLKGVGLAVATWPFAGCIRPDSRPSASIPQTITPPLSTPETTVVTVPSTTTQEPTTTLEPKPHDVVERRDGYYILRNGGFLYPVDSIVVDGTEIDIRGSGGIEIIIQGEGGSRYEFMGSAKEQPSPQETVYADLLTAFAIQKRMPPEAYIAYLKDNNWIDSGAFFPDNISNPGQHVKYPPIVKVPVTIDFKQPFILSTLDVGQIDGLDPFGGTFDYYYPTSADNFRFFLGVTGNGQLVWSGQLLRLSNGQVDSVLSDESVPSFSYNAGYMLSIISGLGNSVDSPQAQWLLPYLAYFVPGGRVDPTTIQDYSQWERIVMNVLDYVTPDFKKSVLIQKTEYNPDY